MLKNKLFTLSAIMLFILATVSVAVSANTPRHRIGPVHGVLPNEGVFYTRYPVYGTHPWGMTQSYGWSPYGHNRYQYRNHYSQRFASYSGYGSYGAYVHNPSYWFGPRYGGHYGHSYPYSHHVNYRTRHEITWYPGQYHYQNLN